MQIRYVFNQSIPNKNTYMFCNLAGNLTSSYFKILESVVSRNNRAKRKRDTTFTVQPKTKVFKRQGGGQYIIQGGGGKVYELLNDEKCDLYCLFRKEEKICDIHLKDSSILCGFNYFWNCCGSTCANPTG